MAEENTLIQVRKETAEKLKMTGTMNDTYDDVVNRILNYYEQNYKCMKKHNIK